MLSLLIHDDVDGFLHFLDLLFAYFPLFLLLLLHPLPLRSLPLLLLLQPLPLFDQLPQGQRLPQLLRLHLQLLLGHGVELPGGRSGRVRLERVEGVAGKTLLDQLFREVRCPNLTGVGCHLDYWVSLLLHHSLEGVVEGGALELGVEGVFLRENLTSVSSFLEREAVLLS